MTLIARYYAEESQARQAHQALLGVGFGRSEVTMIEPVKSDQSAAGETGAEAAEGVDSTSTEIASRAVKAGILLGEASDSFVANLQKGYTLLVVKAPFGRALQATAIVDSQQPIASAGPLQEPTEPYRFISQRATPLSDLFRLKVLTASGASLCDYLGLGTLTGNRSFLTGGLAHSDWSLFGKPPLSYNATPLSSAIGMPVTTPAKSGDGWVRSFGFNMLWNHATPVSSFFGIPLLSDRNHSGDYSPIEQRAGIRHQAAPLSRLLRLKILTSGARGMLSKMLPALLRSDFALFGKPRLSDNAAPLSSITGMPVNSGTSGDDWQSSCGFPLLASNPAPLSRLLGWPLLSEYRTFYR